MDAVQAARRLYLLWVAFKHFVLDKKEEGGTEISATEQETADAAAGRFWPSVMVIELTDLAFAVDSIVAAIGVVGPPPRARRPMPCTPSSGSCSPAGFLGVVLMRYAAVLFIKLLEKFPRFETAAYLLVLLIALKLVVDYVAHLAGWEWISFHDPHAISFWVFWGLMVLFFCLGFVGKRPARVAT